MRLKSFYAKTMSDAMKMVRDTLGEDAVIVATREERGGNIHVTAAVEPHFEISQQNSDPVADSWLQYDAEDEESAVAEEITDAMLRHNVPEDVMDNIISCASVVGMNSTGDAFTAALEHLFTFAPLSHFKKRTPHMLVGMPGAGKTLAAAKIAARGAIAGEKVGVISCDTIRAGGIEQLQAFTNLLNVELLRADDAAHLAKGIAMLQQQGCETIVIDTPGINPFDKDDVKVLARLINAAPMHAHLVLQAGTDTEECSELARVFSMIGAQTMMTTRIDIARRLGGVLSAAHHGKMTLIDSSETNKVANGLFNMTPSTLARRIMPNAFRTHKTQKH